jgi:hypothetical protein
MGRYEPVDVTRALHSRARLRHEPAHCRRLVRGGSTMSATNPDVKKLQVEVPFKYFDMKQTTEDEFISGQKTASIILSRAMRKHRNRYSQETIMSEKLQTIKNKYEYSTNSIPTDPDIWWLIKEVDRLTQLTEELRVAYLNTDQAVS